MLSLDALLPKQTQLPIKNRFGSRLFGSSIISQDELKSLGIGQPRINPPSEIPRWKEEISSDVVTSPTEFIPDEPYSPKPLENPDYQTLVDRGEAPKVSGPIYSEPLDPDLVNKSIEYFGTTNRPLEAGYIMPRGQLLDFSGRHYAVGYKDKKPKPGQPDYLRNTRGVDHRELGDLVPRGGTEGMIDFIDKSGAIRYDARTNFYDGIREPTSEQKRFMKKMIDYAQGATSIDMYKTPRQYDPETQRYNFDENQRMAEVYPLGTPTVKVLSDINRFFKKGKNA